MLEIVSQKPSAAGSGGRDGNEGSNSPSGGQAVDGNMTATEADRLRHQAAHHIIGHCGNLHAEEAVAIIYCDETAEVGEIFVEEARRLTDCVDAVRVASLGRHGEAAPAAACEAMMTADLICGLTRMSMAHTQARIDAGANGARYLSLPDYSLELMDDPCLLVDFRARGRIARWLADVFTNGRTIRVTTSAGTDITIDAGDRVGNCCPGYVEKPGDLGSPPDIEANVSPLETGSNGRVVVDGSIPVPGIGLLDRPVVLTVADGRITDFAGDPSLVETLRSMFAAVGSDKAYVLAECGVGLNDKARLTGAMLTDEGALGTMHFGFGSNATVGGENDVPFHTDFVFRNATLEVDGRTMIRDGEVLI